jgi:hypothetical protein
MKSLIRLSFTTLLLLTIAQVAALAEKVPAGCKAQCRAQYLAMIKYNDAFNRAEESAVLKKAFGEPVRQAVGKTDQLQRWRGKEFDFFELLDGAGKVKLEGIFVKGNPAYARIHPLDMAESMGPGKPDKWYLTAKDLSLGYTLEDCHNDFSGPYAHSYVLSPSCYFGKPGHYSYYAFQYSLLNQPCLKDIETFGLNEGLKKCPQNLPATAVYIWDDNVAYASRELAEFLASGK